MRGHNFIAIFLLCAIALFTFVNCAGKVEINPKDLSSMASIFWKQGGFGACSVTCGGGTQTQTVTCEDAAGNTLADAMCTDPKPPVSQACNTQACPPPIDVFNTPGCGGHYCACVVSGQIGVPDETDALAICKLRGYNSLVSFTTHAGIIGALQCNADGTSCFTNANSGNLICATVTCL